MYHFKKQYMIGYNTCEDDTGVPLVVSLPTTRTRGHHACGWGAVKMQAGPSYNSGSLDFPDGTMPPKAGLAIVIPSKLVFKTGTNLTTVGPSRWRH